MTEYRTLPIESIIITRDERQRKELKNIESLMRSISTIGVINPPVVTDELILIAGERRLTACERLGHSHITVAIRETMPTAAQRQIELAENVDRMELEWKDKCFAVKEYHELAQASDPNWTQEDSAQALNLGATVVSRHISLAKELEAGTELIVNASAYSVALGIYDRLTERRANVEKDRVRAMLSGTPAKVEDALGAIDLSAPVEGLPEADLAEDSFAIDTTETPITHTPFRCSDFKRFSQTYSGVPFNFLHCDFPYGVNADKHNSGAAEAFGGYEDSKDIYFELISSLGFAMETLVAESAHMMFWYSMDYHNITIKLLEEMGWKVNPFPLIWYKSDNAGILPDPKRGPRRNYETALLCSRGDRKIVQAVSNVAPSPLAADRIHMSEKPIPMLRHFFRMFVDETTHMLDPTMGSGNAVVLAESLGAKVRGLELNKTFYEQARDRYLAGGYKLGDGK